MGEEDVRRQNKGKQNGEEWRKGGSDSMKSEWKGKQWEKVEERAD